MAQVPFSNSIQESRELIAQLIRSVPAESKIRFPVIIPRGTDKQVVLNWGHLAMSKFGKILINAFGCHNRLQGVAVEREYATRI